MEVKKASFEGDGIEAGKPSVDETCLLRSTSAMQAMSSSQREPVPEGDTADRKLLQNLSRLINSGAYKIPS